MTNQLRIGQIIRNLGILAKVAGFQGITGDPILRPLWNDGGARLVDAAKYKPLGSEEAGVLRYKDGLMSVW